MWAIIKNDWTKIITMFVGLGLFVWGLSSSWSDMKYEVIMAVAAIRASESQTRELKAAVDALKGTTDTLRDEVRDLRSWRQYHHERDHDRDNRPPVPGYDYWKDHESPGGPAR